MRPARQSGRRKRFPVSRGQGAARRCPVLATVCPRGAGLCEEAMADVYQPIWSADQEHAGLKAVARGALSSAELAALAPKGYVVVNEKVTPGQNNKLIEQVVIPDAKKKSYERVAALFDNYNLNDWENEENT